MPGVQHFLHVKQGMFHAALAVLRRAMQPEPNKAALELQHSRIMKSLAATAAQHHCKQYWAACPDEQPKAEQTGSRGQAINVHMTRGIYLPVKQQTMP
jgi:Pyruvate/2-oxoacid:ferredoxin oxidoreductase delta subunit